MKITEIALKDFRAFYTPDAPLVISLGNGKNLLVYGENGSGKSSLFLALKLFFESSVNNALKFDDYRNIYTSSNDGFVRLRIDNIGPDGKSAGLACQAQWSQANSTTYGTQILRDANKTKGFVDYKALLETHLLRIEGDRVNIFHLLLETLLREVENDITRQSFAQDWQAVQSAFDAPVHNAPAISKINSAIKELHDGLRPKLDELQAKVNEFLGAFDYSMQVEFVFPGVVYRNKPQKELGGQHIGLKIELFNRDIESYHLFLNEAKLSAIAVAILLAAISLQPPSALRILAFDDVLIGLDMSNRLPVLKILEEHFSDYQIILTTYDRAWFEIVRQHTEAKEWQSVELFAGRTSFCELPIYAPERKYLERARDYVQKPDDTAPDYKAAAVYVRTHFEFALKRFCDDHHLPIQYYENPKDLTTDPFWRVIKAAQTETGDAVVEKNLAKLIEIYRKRVLNPLAHAEEITFYKKEIEDAIEAVNDLHLRLQSLKKTKITVS